MLPVWQTEFGSLRRHRPACAACSPAQWPACKFRPGIWPRTRRGIGARRRHGAGRSWLLSRGPERQLRDARAALAIGGIGASTQHPHCVGFGRPRLQGLALAQGARRLQFRGRHRKDDSCLRSPRLLSAIMPWRPAVGILGAMGVVAAIAIIMLTPRYSAAALAANKADKKSARASARRARFGFPTCVRRRHRQRDADGISHIPALHPDRQGRQPAPIGIALTLIFAGGAVGSFVCAYIGARSWRGNGLLTETLTGILILAILPLPLEAAIAILPLIGVALNGTSSVLYGSVPDLVDRHRRAARLRHFLYRHHRLRRGLARALRHHRRRRRHPRRLWWWRRWS